MSRFNEAFEIVIGHEGGLSLDPRDRGNWTDGAYGQKGGVLKGTKYGVAAHAYPHLDIRNLTLDDARTIYKQNYWDRAGCDNLPDDLALCVFDTAINSGVSRALQLLTTAKTPNEYLDARLRFLQSLSSWPTFGRGWTKRVETLRRQAAQWGKPAAVPVPPTPAPVAPVPTPPSQGARVVLSRYGQPFEDISGARVEIKEAGSVVINATDPTKIQVRVN